MTGASRVRVPNLGEVDPGFRSQRDLRERVLPEGRGRGRRLLPPGRANAARILETLRRRRNRGEGPQPGGQDEPLRQ